MILAEFLRATANTIIAHFSYGNFVFQYVCLFFRLSVTRVN